MKGLLKMTKMPEFNTMDYLKSDIELQQLYLEQLFNEYVQDNNIEAFLSALKPLIELNYNITEFAKKTGINRTYFYKLFNNKVVPDFSTLIIIIKNLGFEIDFKFVKICNT